MVRLGWLGVLMLVACAPAVVTGDDDGSTGEPPAGDSSGEVMSTSGSVPPNPSTTLPMPGTVTTVGPADTGDFSTSGEGSEGLTGEQGCGDTDVGPGEQCDGPNLGGYSCERLGLGAGQLSCFDNCTFDVSQCTMCGDGLIQPGEQCDGDDLQGLDCAALGLGVGPLTCSAMCTFDTSGCMANLCGNGVVNPGEQCDSDDLQGFDCASLGLGDGALSCDPEQCVFDTSGCMP